MDNCSFKRIQVCLIAKNAIISVLMEHLPGKLLKKIFHFYFFVLYNISTVELFFLTFDKKKDGSHFRVTLAVKISDRKFVASQSQRTIQIFL